MASLLGNCLQLLGNAQFLLFQVKTSCSCRAPTNATWRRSCPQLQEQLTNPFTISTTDKNTDNKKSAGSSNTSKSVSTSTHSSDSKKSGEDNDRKADGTFKSGSSSNSAKSDGGKKSDIKDSDSKTSKNK